MIKPDRIVTTTCPYCGVGCMLNLHIKEDVVYRVTSPFDAPANKGNLCVKGRFGYDFIHSKDRLTQPLMRKDGKLLPATWDEAMGHVASRLLEIREKYGPDSIGFLVSAKCTNEENYLLQKVARGLIGTNNVDHCARLCHSSSVAGLAIVLGSGAMTNSIGDVHQADVLLVTGSNTTEAHPVISLEMKKAVRQHGAKLILIDPREIELSNFAAIHIRPRSGTDVALLNAMAHVIISEGLAKKEFIEARTENFDAFKDAIKDCTPQWGEDITGVPAEMIIEAAQVYGRAGSAAIFWAMGITQSSHGVDNVQALANLALLTGNFGRPGTGVNPLRGQNNVQGACDVGGLPNVITGYQPVADENVCAKFEAAWQTSVKIPPKPGLTVTELMSGVLDGRIKALYIMGENPIISDPNTNHVREALNEVEFLVSQDIFLNETAQMAHVVLPGVSFAEKDGTFTNTERRVQLIRPALPIRGEARRDLEIICDLGQRLSSVNADSSADVVHPVSNWNYAGASAVWDEIAALTPTMAGISHERLGHGGLQWPCPTADHPGTPILHKEKFTRGLGKFTPLIFREPIENPDEEYPFTLNTGRVLQHWHGGTMSRRSEGLDWIVPEGEIQINEEDGANLGIETGELVRVLSRRGEATGKARLTSKLPRGMVFMNFHFAEVPTNALTGAGVDPVAKIPEYKVSAVKIERV